MESECSSPKQGEGQEVGVEEDEVSTPRSLHTHAVAVTPVKEGKSADDTPTSAAVALQETWRALSRTTDDPLQVACVCCDPAWSNAGQQFAN